MGRIALLFLELGIVAVSTWAFLKYEGTSLAQTILGNFFKSGPSALPLTLVGVLGGTLVSIPFLRRRGRRRTPQETNLPFVGHNRAKVHPLMLTPRPSRDPNFLIRKTKRKGRISRNRSGERLPPNNSE
jgi:hypothetical protein